MGEQGESAISGASLALFLPREQPEEGNVVTEVDDRIDGAKPCSYPKRDLFTVDTIVRVFL